VRETSAKFDLHTGNMKFNTQNGERINRSTYNCLYNSPVFYSLLGNGYNYFSFLSRLCHGKSYKPFSQFQISPRATTHCVAGSILP
jgi:hypothetical protein